MYLRDGRLLLGNSQTAEKFRSFQKMSKSLVIRIALLNLTDAFCSRELRCEVPWQQFFNAIDGVIGDA